jgi:hypothetical protein
MAHLAVFALTIALWSQYVAQNLTLCGVAQRIKSELCGVRPVELLCLCVAALAESLT